LRRKPPVVEQSLIDANGQEETFIGRIVDHFPRKISAPLLLGVQLDEGVSGY
jgi:hypothetical protein